MDIGMEFEYMSRSNFPLSYQHSLSYKCFCAKHEIISSIPPSSYRLNSIGRPDSFALLGNPSKRRNFVDKQPENTLPSFSRS